MVRLRLDDHLCFKLYVASRLIIRGFDDGLAPMGLTYPKYLALLALSEADGETVGNLADRLSLDFGTLSPLLKSLAQAGYIDRLRQADDERVVVNHLTESGIEVLEKAKRLAFELFCSTEFTPAEFKHMHERMDTFIDRCKTILGRRSPRSSRPRVQGSAPEN